MNQSTLEVTIRQETKDDQPEVYAINTQAFGQEGEAMLVDRLRKTPSFVPELSLVATSGDRLVGHILFSIISISDGNGNKVESLALAPMAVRPEFQQQGIGGQLIQNGLKKARELKYTSVIVLGHEHYYPKFGFLPAEKWDIQSPYDVPSSFFMAVELIPDGLKDVNGMVQYPKEFEGV